MIRKPIPVDKLPRRQREIAADNGSEFHGYPTIEQALGLKFHFATPHHAWDRGTNENTNGLIRQYLPKASTWPSSPSMTVT